MEDLQKDKDQGEKLRSLVEVSRKNDIPALLNAKNRAQQDVYSDPSKENLAVLERATAMLEKAMDAGQNCKNWKEALTYLQEDCGRKIGQTKLFADIKAGRLRKQPDGTFKRRDLDRYAASLPTAGTPDKLATDAARRQRERKSRKSAGYGSRRTRKSSSSRSSRASTSRGMTSIRSLPPVPWPCPPA